ncbi:hypothetical protein V6N12_009788 [Hibiscus sabdariffa]|uniref:Uncharacterized protein n=1 Tax=Hibiscus sabdariffa TaxID=183260 RepID=A0ABR2EBQ6_9ROSI
MDVRSEQAKFQGEGVVVSAMVRDEQAEWTKSTAYRKSNPDRRAKTTGNVANTDKSIDVIPLVEGSTFTVDSHVLANISGDHRAISIQEKTGDGRGSARAKFNDWNNNRGKGIKEVNVKGLRVRKKVDVRLPNRVLLSDWVQLTSNQLQLAVDSSRVRIGDGNAMEEDGREADSP